MKFSKINDTTYESLFPNIRTRIGGDSVDAFVPEILVDLWEGECKFRLQLENRPYSIIQQSEDKITLSEVEHFDPYEVGVLYTVDDRVFYEGQLYRIVQTHTSQADWKPNVVPALYTPINLPGEIGEWVQPLGAHDAWNLGDKCLYDGKIWESTINANVWAPGVYGWVETDGQKEVELYPLASSEDMEDGGFEFNIILKQRPLSNVVQMEIETDNLGFHYQPPLTQEMIDEGAGQEEKYVGSYAVYHKTRGILHRSEEEAEKYKTGKAFHIFRPWIFDANGDGIWGELSIDTEEGILSVTVDDAWLNNAAYPVNVDPTLGYTGNPGGTNFDWGTRYARSEPLSPPETGYITSIRNATGWAGNYRHTAVYNANTGALLGASGIVTNQADSTLSSWRWYDFSPMSYVPISPEGSYWLVAKGDHNGQKCFGDAITDFDGAIHATTWSTTFQDPAPAWTSTVYRWGLYAWYEAGTFTPPPTVTTAPVTGIQATIG